ncbi:AMP-binding protein [Gemmobacter nectariphilus]|uniref:AMP-binding protein n=1 Tax=Gemmobacter nectariphilus TaxID=220343 RepID=UPI00041744AF|nr:AMP-binding protein [Gemmobacter nectariphilus]
MTPAFSPSQLLTAQAARFADRPLFIVPQSVAAMWGTDQTEWTYAEVEGKVQALRAAYAAAGYGPGHRVALLLENRPAHFFHWLALNGLGVAIVPINPDATHEEIAYLTGHSGAVLAVATASRLAQMQGHGLPAIADGDPVPAAPTPAGAAAAPGDGECALIYTSGTTGKPKGCILSDLYFMNWGTWYVAQPSPIALREGIERLMTPLPSFHINAMGNSFMGMLACGGAQVIVDRFHPRSWWDNARETGATCFHFLGVMPAILLAIPPSDRDRDHGLRYGMGGGVHPDHHAVFEARFGVPLLEGWAMTETGGACLLSAVTEPRHVGERCIGRPDRPGPGMDYRVIDDQGLDVSPGTPGELVVRAQGSDPRRGLFSGYLNDPVATETAWKDGWFHTGDIVRQDADGALYFMDRKKNVIRRSGENIAALEVEGVINAHPLVAQCAVVAADEPLRGEEVMAVVVPKPGADEPALARALLDHAAERLAYFKVPGFVVFRDSLPVTSTQKVRKADLGGLTDNPMADPRAHDLRAEKQALRRPAIH